MSVAASETHPRKRHRGSSQDNGHLLSASRRLSSLGFPHASSSSRHEPRGPVAFSNDGLVAYRVPHSQPSRDVPSSSTSTMPAFTIAIKPLLAAWKAKPLLLSVPVLPVPTGGYSVGFLSFSSPGNSLVAIVDPDEEAVFAMGSTATQGVVCIWSRRGDASALNEGWSLAAAWPLASNGLGPFGPSILAARWLPSSSRTSPKGDLNVVAAGETMQETPALPSAQLPGMANEGKAKAKKPKVIKVERNGTSGPVLLAKGPKTPEGLVLIGGDGRAHLIHRDTAIHVNASASPSYFAVQTVSLSFPSIGSPGLEQALAPAQSVKLMQVAMHPIVDEPVLLVATMSETNRQRLINLCELTITNEGDEAVIVGRPLQSIKVPAQASSEDGSSSSSGHEGTGLIAFSSSKADSREIIHLTFASAETSTAMDLKTRTSLFSYSVERRTDISGGGSLHESFSTLESKKKQVKDLREQWDWGSRLQSSRVIQDHRSLVSLAAADRGKGKLRAVWQGLHETKATLRRSESLLDAITLEEDLLESQIIFPTEPSWSTSGALAAWVGSSSICLRAATAPPAEERGQIEKLAVAIAGPLLNNRTYHDVLLGNVKLLASSSNRRKLLEVLASSLDWQSPSTAAQEKPLPNIVVLTKLLGVHKSVCAAVETFDPREVDTSVALESLEADWTLGLIRAFKILQCSRNAPAATSAGADSGSATASWDIASLFSVLPVLSYLTDQCESLAREAFLARSGQPITPPESPPKTDHDSEGERPRPLPLLSVLDLLTRPLLCKIFLLVLRAAESFKQWVRSTSVDQSALRELAGSEARQLAQEVRIASHARAASRASAQGTGAGADAEREREQERERESQQLKADTLSAIEANRAMAVSARLEVARLGIEEMERKSAVHVDVVEKRLRSWTVPASSQTTSSASAADGATQDWTWPVGTGSEGEEAQRREEVRKSLARHLLSTSIDQEEDGKSGASSSPLKNHGLPLFITEDDFIHTLADLSCVEESGSGHAGGGSSAAGKRKTVSRDGVTFAPLAPSSVPSAQAQAQRQGQVRRDLTSLEGRQTTLAPASRQVIAQGGFAGAPASTGGPNPLTAAAATGGGSGSASADLLASTLSLQNVLGTAGGSGATPAPAPAPAAKVSSSSTAAPAALASGSAATPAAAASGQASLAPPLSLGVVGTAQAPAPTLPGVVASSSGSGAQGGAQPEAESGAAAAAVEDLVTELLARPGRVERMLLASAGAGAGVGVGTEEGWWLVG